MNSFHNDPILYIDSISTGFIEIPGQISINIYASGCMKRCPECQNAELQKFRKNKFLSEDNFIESIKSYKMAKWICFLGGDAVYQPKGLNIIANLSIKQGYRTCLYTGMNFLELTEVNKDNFDLVIDGPYIKELGGLNSIKTNQNCYLKQYGTWKSYRFDQLEGMKL